MNALAQKCPEPLRRQIECDPDASLDLILRVAKMDNAEAGDVQQREIEAAGFVVRRRMRIVSMFAVTGPGEALLAIVEQPWLLAVEPDQPVRAL